jgi:hypothetical protein
MVASPGAVLAGEYGAQNLGGSTYLTWLLLDVEMPPLLPNRPDKVLVGYACVTKDGLASMSQSGFIHRYAIYAEPYTDYRFLESLNGVAIAPGDAGFVARESTPQPPADLWDYAELDGAGAWFVSDIEPDALGLACVNAGVAGALQELQQVHPVPIQME